MRSSSNQPNRRAFLEAAGLASTASLLTGAATESARGYQANDTIEIACLGTGGRCRHLMTSLPKIPNVRIAAVCDVWDAALEEGKKLADPQAIASKKFQELLDREDIDAVLIGSPDHWHVPMAVAACQAGKDVYVEKPLTHDPGEGALFFATKAEAIIEAQNGHKRIVQVGTQQRSMPHIKRAKERIEEDAIGKVFKVQMSWNRGGSQRMSKEMPEITEHQVVWSDFLGSAPKQPFDPYRMRNWRWFWDFGGGLLTDLMVHWVDTAHWILEVDQPKTAWTLGQHFAADGIWETPDTIQCLLEYNDKLQMHFEGTFSNAHRGARLELLGSKGSMWIDRGGYFLYPEPNATEPVEQMDLGTDPKRGRDFYDLPDGELLHLSNWIECIRSREKPNAPAEAGVAAALSAQVGNRAYRKGGTASIGDGRLEN
jgi:predicted dehydrogenase